MRPCLLLVAVLSAACARAEQIAFIGAPLAAERSEKGCEEYLLPSNPDGPQQICMSRAFLLRYQVLDWISGPEAGSVVQLVGLYHYWGLPYYTQYESALVIADEVGEHLILRKMEYAEDREGGWWVCEEWPEDPEADCERGRFVEEVVRDLR